MCRAPDLRLGRGHDPLHVPVHVLAPVLEAVGEERLQQEDRQPVAAGAGQHAPLRFVEQRVDPHLRRHIPLRREGRVGLPVRVGGLGGDPHREARTPDDAALAQRRNEPLLHGGRHFCPVGHG
jgi:hypothetical protein